MTDKHPLHDADLASLLLAMPLDLGELALDDPAAWPAAPGPSAVLPASTPAPVLPLVTTAAHAAAGSTPAIAFPHATFDEMFGGSAMSPTIMPALHCSPHIGEAGSLSSPAATSPALHGYSRDCDSAPPPAGFALTQDIPPLSDDLTALHTWFPPTESSLLGLTRCSLSLTELPHPEPLLQQDDTTSLSTELWDSLFHSTASTSCPLPASPPVLLESGLPIAEDLASLPGLGFMEASVPQSGVLQPSLSERGPFKLEPEAQPLDPITIAVGAGWEAQVSAMSTPASASTPNSAPSQVERQPSRRRSSASTSQSSGRKLTQTKFAPYDRPSSARPHQCPECHRAFERVSNLRQHVLIHDPDRARQWKCPIPWCKDAFVRRHDAQRHVLSRHLKRERLQDKHTSLILNMFPNLQPDLQH